MNRTFYISFYIVVGERLLFMLAGGSENMFNKKKGQDFEAVGLQHKSTFFVGHLGGTWDRQVSLGIHVHAPADPRDAQGIPRDALVDASGLPLNALLGIPRNSARIPLDALGSLWVPRESRYCIVVIKLLPSV